MTKNHGLRAGTRHKFAKPYRGRGMPTAKKYLATFRRGEYVTIKVDPSIQNGMPHHAYHGKTGIVFDIRKRAIGVEIKKVVGHRELLKRLLVRKEHVEKSQCRVEYIKRRVEAAEQREKAVKAGVKFEYTKRQPKGPREALSVVPSSPDKIEVLRPLTFIEKF